MPPKDKKQKRPSRNSQRGTATTPSGRKPNSLPPNSQSKLSIGGNVEKAIIMVFSGTLFSENRLFKRIQLYRRQPSQLFFDIPYMIVAFSVILSVSYLVFVFLYYGTNTTIFSNTGSLLLFANLDSSVFKLLSIAGIAFLIVILYRIFSGLITKSSLQIPSLSIFVWAIFACALVVFAAKLRFELIRLNYPLSRADELVNEGQFERAKEILLLYPVAQRMPSYAEEVAQERNSQKPISPTREDNEQINETLETFKNVISQLYIAGNYQEVIRTVCGVSGTDLLEGLMPYWRGAAYVMAHDPATGPETTLDWIRQVNDEFPDCQKISSPFWLAIPPEIAWFIQIRNWDYGEGQLGYLYWRWTSIPLDKSIDEGLPDTNIRDICKGDPPESLAGVDDYEYQYYRRCEYDMRLVEDYLGRFPDDRYADYAKLVLGRLDQIIEEGSISNKNVYDFAFYEKGWRQYRKEDYEGALKTFQAFLFADEFRTHPWRDDALWRAATCYQHLGKYIDALQYLSRMESETDGYVPGYADMDSNALYIADVLMPIDELARVVSENLFPNLLPILKYTLAERLLAEGSYTNSRELFGEISNQYRGQTFEPKIGKKYSLSELANQKLEVIRVLMSYQEKHRDDANLLIADYLETYEAFSPLENDLRYYIDMFEYPDRRTTGDYLVNRSKTFVAAKLREEYVNNNPRDPRVADLLFKIAQGYETVASWQDLPGSASFLATVRKKASDSYIKYLDHPNNDSKKVDEAMEHAGGLYLTRCLYYEEFQCDIESIQGMRNVYLQLANKYPKHRLANNFLNWIAWSYCYEANLPGNSDQQYVDAYRLALATYYRIATDYPDGAIGENARRNMKIIEEKIKNPSNKEQFPPANWEW